ncbi:MAG: PLP-dependent aminotransferase family protein [Burkholderiales bacterium]|jgi:2-aminoadipate transaminase|nr:MAG: PLP-dependent aminotransferase family protein [Burkholderiales bacterium]
MSLTLAARTRQMNSSAIREILKLTERPGVLSLAGGLPSPDSFPLEALAQASEQVWRTQGAQAMQYANSEGLMPLRAWFAERLSRPEWPVRPEQVLVTTGSQQGLDLLGKVLLDPGRPVWVEQPTYLGALQAFAVYEPVFKPWAHDAQGPDPAALLDAEAASASAAYLVPSYQNPSGLCLSAGRRRAIAEALNSSGVTLVEDNPYGELWYDEAPPLPIAAQAPHHTVYLGSLSKVLAPGLRIGCIVTPPDDAPGALALRARLLQAKQATDLHTPGFNQRLVLQLLANGFDLDAHVAQVRLRYKAQRDAMAAALTRHMPPGCAWQVPQGGMFFWMEGPQGFDAAASLHAAVEGCVAYVPGSAFYVGTATGANVDEQALPRRQMRLSFVTLSVAQIEEAVRRLADHIRHAVAHAC